MKRWLVALSLLALGLPANADIGQPSPQHADRAFTSGPAVAVGFGCRTPALGLEVDYYLIPADAPGGLAAYVGAGWWPPIDQDSLSYDSSFGFAVGAEAFLGHRHRLFVDLGYGMGGLQGYGTTGKVMDEQNLYGANATVGYEYAGRSGFLFRAGGGITYYIGDLFKRDASHVGPTFELAFGFKVL